ncbi:hypothetical protein DB88DRAFT_475704 [Papiliotrema laurentii]|uniref:Uncharacterized protein n=1 Tax=Papiliotrema laurentii TaxID=5418 RepID=A0AAD9FMC2_PAPLA|nr:hypothetical protein DB88DRAFT_475704 [Papiliotrema laurentii]
MRNVDHAVLRGAVVGIPAFFKGLKVMWADGSREHSAAKAYCTAGTDGRIADHMPKMRVVSLYSCETRSRSPQNKSGSESKQAMRPKTQEGDDRGTAAIQDQNDLLLW